MNNPPPCLERDLLDRDVCDSTENSPCKFGIFVIVKILTTTIFK